MGDKTGLQKLGDEFCTAVRANTRSKYTDIEERLDILMNLIRQNKDATKITTELERIEKALKDKNESHPKIRDGVKNIRDFWDLKKGKKTETVKKGKQKPIKKGPGQEKTETKQTKSSQSQSGTDLSINGKAMAQPQETDNGDQDMTSEITYFEQNLTCLLKMFTNDKGGVLKDMFQLPKETQLKQKIQNGHVTLLGVGEQIRRMKSEKEHLENVLQKLSSKVKVGNENTTDVDENDLKLPKDVKIPAIVEIYTKAAEISNKFEELNGDLNFACRRMSELLSAVKGHEEQEAGVTKTNAKGRNKQNKDTSLTPPILDQAKKLDNEFYQIQSELIAKKHLLQDAQNQIKQKQLLESIMDDLSKDVQGLVEGRTQVTTQSALDQRKTFIDREKEGSTYQRLEQVNAIYKLQIEMKREADYAAQLLEDLNNCIQNYNSVEGTNILTKPDTPGSINEGKEKQQVKGKRNLSNNAPDKNQQSRHATRMQKHFETAKSILLKHTDVQSQIDEKQFIESTMDDLSKDVQDLVEGKIKIGMQSALDQRTSSIDKDKEGSKFQRMIQAKKIYELQFELQKEAKYAALLLDELNKYTMNDNEAEKKYILTEPQIFESSDDVEQDQVSSEEKLRHEGEKQTTRHFLQLKKLFETALIILDKQIHAQYAAQLLKDLGNFSKKTEGESDKHILSDPPTNATQSRNGGKPTKEEIAQKNKGTKEYLENATLILNQIKERQRLLRVVEKEDMKVKHQKEGQKNIKETGDSLNADIKTETKQKGQDKLQRLEEEISALKKEADSLRTRLSQIAGAKLVHENPAIADLSDPNRPTKLGEKFSQLYDNQWTEAYSALQNDDKKASDEKLTGNLYNILIDIYRFCEDKRCTQKKNLEDMFFYPTVNMESGLRRQMECVSEIFAKHLSDALKVSGDVASLNMVQVFKTDKAMKSKYGKRMQQCKSFIEESVKLCWLMQIQTPPLCIDTKTARGDELVKDKYKEYTRKGQKIAFVVWPALFLHENGPLVAKGVAQGE